MVDIHKCPHCGGKVPVKTFLEKVRADGCDIIDGTLVRYIPEEEYDSEVNAVLAGQSQFREVVRPAWGPPYGVI